ncbi:plasmid pRiA4b ORF-3 family protein [Arthrobacter sp. GMC3]|uniref:plasmid pRiA4b ORF-3 family protein n=1 Tax=Arthrobacter sp. GMC3 TaxID=2058894 RepID=UPI000CE34624|nr:plasmid pRiA4b ORF-3 family protein [Arthrobacter sp. GMC3]
MAKKSKTSHFGSPAKAAASKSVLSFTDVVAERALEPLMPGFRAWASAAGIDPEQIDWLSGLLQEFFKNYAQSVPDVDACNLEVPLTSKVLESAAAFHPEMRLGVALALNTYLEFLSTTGAWAGTPNDLAQLLKMTGPERAAAGLKLSQYAALPSLTPAEEGVARAQLLFVRRAVALLAWLGEGRKLTDARLLPRKDIAAAAACVDTNAVGSTTSRPDPLAGPDAAIPVTSMIQLPRLMQYWQALIDTRLITVKANRVTVTRIGKALRENPAEADHDTAVLAYFLFYDSVIPYGPFDPEESIQVMIALALADAASNKPVEADTLFGPDILASPRAFQAILVGSRIREAAEEGLVEIGTHIIVPPVLRSPLASALKLLDDKIEEITAKKATEARAVNRAPSQASYQLKIQIDDITPPVWRRVEVPAEIALDELHGLIQRLFAWEDRHLHEFRIGDHATGVRYAPDDPEADHWGTPPLDERDVALNSLLTAPSAAVHYLYDFGDSWEHTITLEKILPAAAPGMLPRCTDGGGHPPQEDAFGPHGWMEKLAIARDSNHPEHHNIRAWLGLRKGQEIDPEAFDTKAVAKRLKSLA